jgi:WD40 repeat protein
MAQWDAFISYARSASTREAQRLQTAIQTFAKPWYRLRAVRIFRDDSSMSANPALWSSIEQGLREARFMVVLLSRAAARSEYVAGEIAWWLRNKDASSILLVHDDGTLAWDRQRNDFTADTDCVPAPLRGAFREEPRWTDLSWFDAPGSAGPADPRFTEKVADLAATIRGIPRDELVGDDVVQHKRAWRLAKVAIGALSLLLIASVVASIIAIAQRNQVQRQATALLARQLAVTADSLLTRDLRRAQLLAVQAYRTDPTADTRAALLRATLASPALRRFVTFAAEITALSPSSDGRFVAVGLDNGEVYSWDVAQAAPVARLRLAHRVLDVGISDDAQVLAAVDGTSTLVATGTGVGTLVVPTQSSPGLVAVSPSGTGIVICSRTRETRPLTLVDLVAKSQRTVASTLGTGPFALQFAGDDQVVLSNPGAQRRTFPGFKLLASGDFNYGNHSTASRLSGDGAFTSSTNGDAEVAVWPIDGDQDHPPRYAFVPMTQPRASALNYDASRLAVADADGIHVAEVRKTEAAAGYGHSADPARLFEGITQVNDTGLAFLGRTSRFVAASGSDLSLWDPDSSGRSSTTAPIAVDWACMGCGSPTVALSPDSSTMAVRDGNWAKLLVTSVPGNSGNLSASYAPTVDVGYFAPPVWLDGSTVLQVAAGTTQPSGAALPALPPGLIGWTVGVPDTQVLLVRPAADRSSVLVVTGDGRIQRRDARTGALQSEVTVAPPASGDWFDAAVDDDLSTVALTPAHGTFMVVDAATGKQRFTIADADVSRSLFAAGSLWVRYNSGVIERRDAITGAVQRRLPGRLTVSTLGELSQASGVLAIPTDQGVTLYDTGSDATLGSVDSPRGWGELRRGSALSVDGSALVTVFEPNGDGGSGLAITTTLAPEALVAVACRTSGGSLTPADWTALVGPDVPADLTCR